MRRLLLVTILGATGACVLAAALSVWFAAREQPEGSPRVASVVVEIPDNPATLAASKVQEAEAIVALPGAAHPAGHEPIEAGPPQNALIVDAIRRRLQDSELREGANPDDLTALQTFYANYVGPPLWIDDAGLCAEAHAVIDEIGKADDWGLDSAPSSCRPRTSSWRRPNSRPRRRSSSISLI
jgi:Scaffold domain